MEVYEPWLNFQDQKLYIILYSTKLHQPFWLTDVDLQEVINILNVVHLLFLSHKYTPRNK